MYAIKEAYYTLQGEGAQAGRAAVFLRFAGCNLWNGRDEGRPKAVCKFCDTDFIGTDGENGGKFSDPAELARHVKEIWDNGARNEPRWHHLKTGPLVVCTGGEPLLQLDAPLVAALQRKDLEVAVETNGTVKAPAALDWICVSPKADAKLLQVSGSELKLVYPQEENKPEDFEDLDFTYFYLQPKDDENKDLNTLAAVNYCLMNPQWRLSLQTHKLLGLK